MIPKCRIYCYETQEMIVANGYEELSELFMALNADDSLYSEPMQSTGLVDKNGQEIFEGDIVHAYSEYTRLIGAIEYFDNAYYIKTKNGVYTSLWINAEYYEVIGNVFEHIHLNSDG